MPFLPFEAFGDVGRPPMTRIAHPLVQKRIFRQRSTKNFFLQSGLAQILSTRGTLMIPLNGLICFAMLSDIFLLVSGLRFPLETLLTWAEQLFEQYFFGSQDAT